MITVTLTLPPEVEGKLRDKAGKAGLTLEAYLQRLAERDVSTVNGVTGPGGTGGGPKTFDEILAPVRQGFADSGLSEEEIDALFKEAREEVWRDNQQNQG
jgi:hypothetical protein